MKAINPFLIRIPGELHEQYMTDILTEVMETKMAETNNSDDDVIFVKYGIVVALARKA
jgi:hypothetical protein